MRSDLGYINSALRKTIPGQLAERRRHVVARLAEPPAAKPMSELGQKQTIRGRLLWATSGHRALLPYGVCSWHRSFFSALSCSRQAVYVRGRIKQQLFRELPKSGDVPKSPLLPIGSPGAVGRHIIRSTIDQVRAGLSAWARSHIRSFL